MAGNPAVDGNPKMLYLLCRNTGYDANNPDPNADNAPDLSPPDPADPNFYFENMQTMAQIYVADDNSADANADHRHWMPVPGKADQSSNTSDPHFHYSMVKEDGSQLWTTEMGSGQSESASQAQAQTFDLDDDGDVDVIVQSGASATAVPVHSHETVTQYVINSLGEEYYRMRPKWMLCLGKCNSWTHQHWTDNGGGRTIIIAQRPYISGDDADPSTWEFDTKPENDQWTAGYFDQINNFWNSRFGLALPVDDGSGDKGINNDRRLIEWWHSINRFQWVDSTRFG